MPAITVRSALINKIGSNEVTTLRVSVDRSLASAGGPSSAGVVASGAVTVSVGTFLLPALTLYSTYNAPDAATQGAIYKAELLDGSGNVVTELPGFASFLLRVPATQCTWNSIQEWNEYLTLIQATNLDTLGNSTTPVVGLSCVGVLGAYTTASRDTITLFFGSSINAPGIRRNVATAQMEYSHDGLTWAAMGSGGGSGVTGSGTVSYVPLWTAGTVLGDSPISYASIDLTVVINNHTSLEKSLKIGNDQFVFNGDPARAVNVNQAVFKTITGQTGDVLRVDNTANTGGFPFRVRANGDVYIRGIAYQWPSGAPAGVLTNDGSLNLSWAAPTVTIQDEGATQGAASTLNFVGGAVTASVSSGIATITITGGGGMTSWNFAADGGTTPQSISDAQTLTFVGGNGITTNGSGTRQLTIAVDLLSTGGLQTSGGAAQLGIKLDTVTGGGNNAAVLSANGLYVPPGGGGGGGTVTSVALSLPSFITVSGSPVTTSGTLTGTLAAQSANTVFAGPATGAAAAPTFRALVNADIASLRTWTVEDSDGTTLAITGGTQFGILGDGNSIVTNLAGNSVEISVQTLNTGGLTILPGGLAIQLDTVTGGGNNVAVLSANGLYVPPGGGSGDLGNTIVTTSSYSFAANDYAVIVQNTALAVITLPNPAGLDGHPIVVKRGPNSIAQVNLSGTVNGVVGTYQLPIAGQAVQLVSDGATWWVMQTDSASSLRISPALYDINGNSWLGVSPTASATQFLTISNNTATNPVALSVNAPAAAAASIAGTPVSLAASAATAGTSTAGAAAGGAVTIQGGNAARLTSGNANGGNVVLTGGTGIGTGTQGQVVVTNVGAPSAPALAIANSGDGLFSFGSGVLGLSTSGTQRIGINSNGMTVQALGIDVGNQDIWFVRVGTNTVRLSTLPSGGGAATLLIAPTAVTAAAQLHSAVSNASTNTITVGAIFEQLSTGTAANGLGTATQFRLQSSTTAGRTAAVCNTFWATATDASRGAVWSIQTVSNAVVSDREVIAPRKTLTDGAAVDIFDVTLVNNSAMGGTIEATIFATDGTEFQSRSVVLTFQAVNKAGTITSSLTVVSETAAVSSGTLTGTWTVNNGSGKITIRLNADTSLTPTALYVLYQVRPNGEQNIAPL